MKLPSELITNLDFVLQPDLTILNRIDSVSSTPNHSTCMEEPRVFVPRLQPELSGILLPYVLLLEA